MNSSQKSAIFLLIIGVVLFIISQTADFYYTDYETPPNPFGGEGIPLPVTRHNQELKNGLMYGGLVLAAIGGIISLSGKTSPQPTINKKPTGKFCHNCGHTLIEITGSFCEQCGSKLS